VLDFVCGAKIITGKKVGDRFQLGGFPGCYVREKKEKKRKNCTEGISLGSLQMEQIWACIYMLY